MIPLTAEPSIPTYLLQPNLPESQPKDDSKIPFLFAAIPHQLFDKGLKPSTIGVYSGLARYVNWKAQVSVEGRKIITGWTLPISQQRLAEVLNSSRQTMNHHIKLLVDAGVVELKKSYRGCYQYRLVAYKDGIAEIEHERAIHPGVPTVEQVDVYAQADIPQNQTQHAFSRGVKIYDTTCQNLRHSKDMLRIIKNKTLSSCDELKFREISKSSAEIRGSSKESNTKKNEEREKFADAFYKIVLNRPLTNRKKRIGIEKYFKRLMADIAADERVEDEPQACEILKDAFVRVKQEIYPIYSHKIFDVEFGESAIEKAIVAAQEAARGEVPMDEGVESELPETEAPGPSQSEIDAALLETWSDERWEAWVDEQVDDRVKVREMICAQFPAQQPFTPSELADMRTELLARYPADDAQRLVWLRQEVGNTC